MVAAVVDEFLSQRALSDGRSAVVARTLADLEASLSPRSSAEASASDLSAFLDGKLAEGHHPNTVRKSRAILRTFYEWLYERWGDQRGDSSSASGVFTQASAPALPTRRAW